MGRPLKTRKYQADTNTTVDQGFPNNGSTNNGYSNNQPGIVGGFNGAIRVTMNINIPGSGTVTGNTASAVLTGTGTQFAYNGIRNGSNVYANGVLIGAVSSIANATSITMTANSTANVSGATYSFDTGPMDGYILRQKGKSKYMVVSDSQIQDEGIAVGGQYFINGANDTNWNALGAGPDAAYGKVFTATASGVGLTTTGTAYPVGICTLVDSATPAAGEMSMEVYNDGDTTYAYVIKNTRVRDFDNNNTPIDNNANNTTFIATIMNDGGNVDPATGYTIVGVENWC
jgi:hypothetical protein